MLGDRFLHERNVSTYPPQPANPKGERHEHESYFSYDRDRGRIVLRQFHTEGFDGACTAPEPRLGLLATFCGPQFRPQQNQTLGLDPALWGELDDRLKFRLGFVPWNAYGWVESPAAREVHPLAPRIREPR